MARPEANKFVHNLMNFPLSGAFFRPLEANKCQISCQDKYILDNTKEVLLKNGYVIISEDEFYPVLLTVSKDISHLV